ncbi:MAG TPA: hypothetical protein DIS96_17035, partial [Pusillimonas sp.]|nr:hypothetical protein [Pusillimonas sp.]
MTTLSALGFVDLVLGEDYCEAKKEGPGLTRLIDIQASHPQDVKTIRSHCFEKHLTAPEFTLEHTDMRFRVTTMQLDTGPIWFLSRIDAQVRPLSELPVPKDFVAFLLRARLQGLILVTGGFGTGKTTTAASLL